MGIANYMNMSELMNKMLAAGPVSIADLAHEAFGRMMILASEGERADMSDLENGFIALANVLYQKNAIQPDPANAEEERLVQLYKSGELEKNGYGGEEGDQFLRMRWKALTDALPIITNITSSTAISLP
jgi:hypothetical protein